MIIEVVNNNNCEVVIFFDDEVVFVLCVNELIIGGLS